MRDSETADQRLAENLRALRERRAMSQTSLAAAMRDRGFSSWHQQTVGRIEAGQQQARFAEVVELASVLETSLDRLTWSPPEASTAEELYRAGSRVQRSFDDAAQTVELLLDFCALAERAVRDTGAHPSPRVQEARKDVQAQLADYSLDRAVAFGTAMHERKAAKNV